MWTDQATLHLVAPYIIQQILRSKLLPTDWASLLSQPFMPHTGCQLKAGLRAALLNLECVSFSPILAPPLQWEIRMSEITGWDKTIYWKNQWDKKMNSNSNKTTNKSVQKEGDLHAKKPKKFPHCVTPKTMNKIVGGHSMCHLFLPNYKPRPLP